MNKNGREFDVLIERVTYVDKSTGVEYPSDRNFTAWANTGMSKIIKSVEGVTNVFNSSSENQYSIYIDKRYDIDFVSREVEAVLVVATR